MTFSPEIANWALLDDARRTAILQRPPQADDALMKRDVVRIIADVRENGDAALRTLTARLDRCELDSLVVGADEIAAATASVDAPLKAAIDEAKSRIETFHRATSPQHVRVNTARGVVCERITRPIARVGLYVPAGSAPLPSTALMLGVPAQVAGCPEVIVCTPPRADGTCDPAVLYAIAACGISRVFKVGGAQAIAAMAFGTASIARCDKIFGPGNAWVTEAKRRVMLDGATAIDLPAGPSEVLVIGDAQADPDFVAADLLAQAEHGPDSQVVFIGDDAETVRRVVAALGHQLAKLPRAVIATSALAHARFIVAESLDQAIAISNDYAPEHLILNVAAPRRLLESVHNAGSVFLGAWSPESVGDYCSGTNHVLPTYGFARAWSGVSVASFLKQITVQELTPQGLIEIGPCAATLARAEHLHAHERAVTVRLDKLSEAA
jgi:histidinol dehydrogenase